MMPRTSVGRRVTLVIELYQRGIRILQPADGGGMASDATPLDICVVKR